MLEAAQGRKELSSQGEVASFPSALIVQEFLVLIWLQMKLELVKP